MRSTLLTALWLVSLGPLGLVLTVGADDGKAGEGLDLFEKRIRPLLAARCEKCHSQAQGKTRGGLALDTRAGWQIGGDNGSPIIPGKPDASLLIQAVRQTTEGLRMPPQDAGGRLKPDEIAALTQWIRLGAPDPRTGKAAVQRMTADEARHWWSFQPLAQVRPPAVSGDPDRGNSSRGNSSRGNSSRGNSSRDNPIDRFVRARLAARNDSLATAATRRPADSPPASTGSRRLAPAPPADKRILIRRATFDLIGLPPTPQEVAAFVHDDSPDAFAHVVNRLLASPTYGQRWARHWLDVVRYADYYDADAKARQMTAEPLDAWRYRDWVVDALNNDLPFDRFIVHQIAGDLLSNPDGSDIYPAGLIATTFLSNGVWDPHDADKEKIVSDIADDNIDTIGKAFLGLTLGCARCHDHKFDRVTTADYYGLAGMFYSSHILAKLGTKGGAYTMNRVPLVPAAVVQRRQHQLKQLADLQAQLQALDKQSPKPADEDPRRVRLVAAREQLQRELLPEPPRAIAVQEGGTPGGLFPGIQDVPIHIRGSYARLGRVVPRRLPQFLAGDKQPPISSGSGRLQLANWVASADNPLTARVIVNRVWQWHFGAGLVRTPSNFGKLGTRPTHPQLLDWLSGRFVADGWSLKQLHRRIMLSATYQQSSRRLPAHFTQDPENHWLARFAPRRLEAEALRDALLCVAGQLDTTTGGPAGQDFTIQRRSLYVQTARWNRSSFANLFDAANPDASTEKRTNSTIAPQALLLLNHPFAQQQSRRLAERLLHDRPHDINTRIDYAYRLLFARPATAEEIEIARQLIGGGDPASWTLWAHVLLCSNEFVYVD